VEAFWVYEEGEDKVRVRTRADLARPLHGEADISCVFAAHVLFNECGARRAEVRTVDTDIVMIACLNSFPGLQVQLGHFDRKTHEYVKVTYDITALNANIVRKHGISVLEWALLCITRGTDYAARSVSGVPDWAKYMDLLCPLLRGQHCITKGDGAFSIDTQALHG
jgi:hypothetical protein